MKQLTDTCPFSAEGLRALLITEIAVILNLDRAEIDPAKDFDEYGLDSVAAVVLLNAVEQHLGLELEPEIVMRRRSIDEIVDVLANMAVTSSAA
jgi:acyl carrier protein